MTVSLHCSVFPSNSIVVCCAAAIWWIKALSFGWLFPLWRIMLCLGCHLAGIDCIINLWCSIHHSLCCKHFLWHLYCTSGKWFLASSENTNNMMTWSNDLFTHMKQRWWTVSSWTFHESTTHLLAFNFTAHHLCIYFISETVERHVLQQLASWDRSQTKTRSHRIMLIVG